MPGKSKSTKRRTRVRDIPQGAKALSKEDQKKVKGGSTPVSGSTEYKKVTLEMRKAGGDPQSSG